MIKGFPGGKWRGVVFTAANGLVVCGVYFVAVLPISDYLREAEEVVETRKVTLSRTLAAIEQAEAFSKTPVLMSEDTEFYSGTNEGTISAALQSRLKNLAESSAVVLRSVRGMPARKVGRLSLTGARIELSGSAPAVRRLVYGIESTSPALFVTSASMRSAQPPGPAKEASEPTLDAQLEVYAAVADRSAP